MNLGIIIMLLLVIFVFWLCDKKKEKFTNKENIICGIKEKDDKNNLYCKKLDFKNKNSLLDYFSSNNSSKNDTNSWNVIEENVNKVYLSTSKDKDGIQRHNLYTLNDIGELRYRDYNEDGSTTQNLSILKSEKNPIFNDLSIDNKIICGVVDNDDYDSNYDEAQESRVEYKDDDNNLITNNYMKNKILCYDRDITIDPEWNEIHPMNLPEGSSIKSLSISGKDPKRIFIVTKTIDDKNELYYKKNLMDNNEKWKSINSPMFNKVRTYVTPENNYVVCGKIEDEEYVSCFNGPEKNLIEYPEWSTIKEEDKKPKIFKDYNIKDNYLMGIGKDDDIYYLNNIQNYNSSNRLKQIKNQDRIRDFDFNIMN